MPADVAAVLAGDVSGWDSIYRDTYRDVFGFVRHRVGSREVAQDIAASVYVKAMSRISLFVWTGKPILAWLLMIARNSVVDYWKSPRSRPTSPIDELWMCEEASINVWGCPYDHGDDPADILVDPRTSQILKDAVSSLKEKTQRDVILMRFVEDLSLKEVSTRMGISVGAVKALQFRAMRSIRRTLHLRGYTRDNL